MHYVYWRMKIMPSGRILVFSFFGSVFPFCLTLWEALRLLSGAFVLAVTSIRLNLIFTMILPSGLSQGTLNNAPAPKGIGGIV